MENINDCIVHYVDTEIVRAYDSHFIADMQPTVWDKFLPMGISLYDIFRWNISERILDNAFNASKEQIIQNPETFL